MRLSLLLAFLVLPLPAAAATDAELDAVFESYWNADTRAERQAATQEILALAPAFDSVRTRLAEGRPYARDVPTGQRIRTRAYRYPYVLIVPEDYDPARRYPVRFFLHGGVHRPPPEPDGSWWQGSREDAPDSILVIPAAWEDAKWWQWSQAENLVAILNRLKRTYNIDENRVSLSGASDGGTGVYFFAFRQATSWAAFLPFIGHAGVLRNTYLGVDGEMYAANLANRPLFVVNGELDPLYPTKNVRPYLDLFERAGAKVIFHNQPTSGHSMDWWDDEKDNVDAFLADHPRQPLPDRIVWETERTDRYNRFSWLEITELGSVPGESDLDGWNVLYWAPIMPRQAFRHRSPSGRVELQRRGNEVDVATHGVRRYRLLISPDQFDLSRPVTVRTNGNVSFTGHLSLDVPTLLRWAIRDQDRTMLFAAELNIEVGESLTPSPSPLGKTPHP